MKEIKYKFINIYIYNSYFSVEPAAFFNSVLNTKMWVLKRIVGVLLQIRGKSPNMGRFSNKGRFIISYQEALPPLLTNVNHQAHEAVLCNHSINGQLFRNSVLSGHLCFDAL